jgi:hypothetical protein
MISSDNGFVETGDQDRVADKRADEPMLYCPVCNTRLSEFKCKLVCQKCGYFMSCADYY